MTDLLKLADSVENGDAHPFKISNALGETTSLFIKEVNDILMRDSLEAARKLHKKLLPDWELKIETTSTSTMRVTLWEWRYGTGNVFGEQVFDKLAAAWLAAILRAKSLETNNESQNHE